MEKSLKDKNSIFNHHKKLISLRKEYDIIAYGDYLPILEDHDEIFSYIRRYKDEVLLVINNFYGNNTEFILPRELELSNYKRNIMISNYDDSPKSIERIRLRPYESIVYYLVKDK